MDEAYRFTIEGAYTPSTLPMERLAEYMQDFAKLLGEPASVHFRRLDEGSAVLVADVDQPTRLKVRQRLREVREGGGARDARDAFARLDNKLRADNASGRLEVLGAAVLQFPGSSRPEPVVYGPFRQDGTLDGQIYRLGGKDDTIHIHIRDAGREFTALETNIALAQDMRHFLLGPTLRFHGSGLWFRSGDGDWELRSFRVVSFEVLDETPLLDVVAQLQAVEGNHWGELADPVGTLIQERAGEGRAV